MSPTRKACDGESTRTVGEFEECEHCETCIRNDLVAHPFFGFQTCPERTGHKEEPSDDAQ